MIQNVVRWADDWIIENASADLAVFSDSFIAAEVKRLVSDAGAEGITETQLRDALGDLETYMLEEYERKRNEEHGERQGRGD